MSQSNPRLCAIIPVYNHAATVLGVIESVKPILPVIVVDDGSTDGLDAVLKGLRDVTVQRHALNKGKGEALRTGFRKALEMGFTHAVTIDADGQHLASDLGRFLDLCRSRPEALLVGVRDFAASNAPRQRRIANSVSNYWFRMETGIRLSDTQCGYRCYPLAEISRLWCAAQRYGYELEIMVKAAWAGIPIIPVPVAVKYSAETVRGSHFRPLMDMWRLARLNARLALQAFALPRSLLALMSVGALRAEPTWRRVRIAAGHMVSENADSPGRLALSVGLGVFCGLAPIWGGQMVAAVLLAHVLRLNKAIALLASNISVPVLVPFIVMAGFVFGHWLFGGGTDLASEPGAYALQWLVGSMALALAGGLISAALTLLVASGFWRRACRPQK